MNIGEILGKGKKNEVGKYEKSNVMVQHHSVDRTLSRTYEEGSFLFFFFPFLPSFLVPSIILLFFFLFKTLSPFFFLCPVVQK